MGDVFDAMNRSRRERGDSAADAPGDAGQSASEASPESAGPETPALPIDQVADVAAQAHRSDPRAAESDQPRAEPSPSTVAAANEKSQADRQKAATALPKPSADPRLNGYASEVVVHHDRGSLITEQYRSIRTQILARCRNRRLQTHVVTSSAPNEGKSVTAVNLAFAFGELKDQRILLIEGDLRKPTFGRIFNRTFDRGLIQLLNGQVEDVSSVLEPTIYENLKIMPSGGRDLVSSTELLSSPRMMQLLDRLKDQYDHIFIDSPPIVQVTDAAILGAMSDQVMLVVRLGQTPTEVVDRAKRLLRAANCEIAGVILTHMQHHVPKYLYRYA